MEQAATVQWGGASGQGNAANGWGRRSDRRDRPSVKIAAALALISMGMMIASVFMPWYSVYTEDRNTKSIGTYDLFGITYETWETKPEESSFYDYDEGGPVPTTVKRHTGRIYWTQYPEQEDSWLYGTTKALVICAAAAGAVQAAIAAVASRRKWGLTAFTAAGVVCLAITIAVFVLFMLQHPAMVASKRGGTGPGDGPWSSFIGMNDSIFIKKSWGPSIGWFLAVLAGIMSAVSVMPLAAHRLRSRRKAVQAPPTPWYPPAAAPAMAQWAPAPTAWPPYQLPQQCAQTPQAVTWAPAPPTQSPPFPGFPPMEHRR